MKTITAPNLEDIKDMILSRGCSQSAEDTADWFRIPLAVAKEVLYALEANGDLTAERAFSTDMKDSAIYYAINYKR